MNSKQLYGAKPKFKVRLPPAYDNEDNSELSDSDADPEYTPPKNPVFHDLLSNSNTSDSENEAPDPAIPS